MILGDDRLKVIENIKDNANSSEFHKKVELNDPVLTSDQAKEITNNYLNKRSTFSYKFKSSFARLIANVGGSIINKNTEIVGDIDKEILLGGAIITSNHFSPLENTIIRHYARKNGVKRMNVISQVTNFAMPGFIGFLMNYADTIPLSADPRYFSKELVNIIEEKVSNKELVLVYPEQEMWFNYRKPRPQKEGAYHFAAKLSIPIISCFVEIIDEDSLENIDFYKTHYRLHLLGVLHPAPNKSVKENRIELCQQDYKLKKDAYERIYNKKLDYKFESSDIAGWIDYSWVYSDD